MAPRITKIYCSDAIVKMSNIIYCEAEGFPAPDIVLKKSYENNVDGRRVLSLDPVKISTGNGNITRVRMTLNITDVRKIDNGAYLCSASNDVVKEAITKRCSIIVYCE